MYILTYEYVYTSDCTYIGLIDEIVEPNDEKLKNLSLPPPNAVCIHTYICINTYIYRYTDLNNHN